MEDGKSAGTSVRFQGVMSRKVRSKCFPVLVAALGLGLVGCSGEPSAATPLDTVENNSSPSITRSTVEPSTSERSGLSSATHDLADLNGILVGRGTGNGQPYEVGVIDPSSGTYTKFTEFPVEGDFLSNTPLYRLSPDLSKMGAVTIDANGTQSVGWYDSDGVFHPAGPALTKDPFAPEEFFWDANFDYQGNFTYTIKEEGLGYRAFLIDNKSGQISEIDHGGFNGPKFLPDGTYAESNSCYNQVHSFLNPNEYLMVGRSSQIDNAQIYTGSFDELPSLGSCGPGDDALGLLPENNDVVVSEPVATRDRKQVAFFYDRKAELYVVDVAGGRPQLVPGSDWSEFKLLEWKIP